MHDAPRAWQEAQHAGSRAARLGNEHPLFLRGPGGHSFVPWLTGQSTLWELNRARCALFLRADPWWHLCETGTRCSGPDPAGKCAAELLLPGTPALPRRTLERE